ncbi:MAG: hypothetical protein ACYDBJ_21475 [Aggregatilineales bacterium]
MINTINFRPIERMWRDRIEISRQDSDTSLGLDLLYMGEMVTKLVASGLIAAISDDPKRLRYSQIYKLVRADGLGDWSVAIDNTLSGPPAQYLIEPAYEEQKELTQSFGSNSWQYEAVDLLYKCLKTIGQVVEDKQKLEARKWFSTFVWLRNKTRGHGAPQSDIWGKLCPPLEKSLRLMIENFVLFKRPWAYLYRNLSGKYRITYWNDHVSPALENLKSTRDIVLQNGIYISFGAASYQRVELLDSDVEARDYFFPNGAFDDKTFEFFSYITNSHRHDGDATLYFHAPGLKPSPLGE